MSPIRTFDFRRLLECGEMNSWWTWKVVRQGPAIRLDHDETSGESERRNRVRQAAIVPLIFCAAPALWIIIQKPPWPAVALLSAFSFMAVLWSVCVTRMKLYAATDRMLAHFRRTPSVVVVDAEQLRFPPYDHAVPLSQVARVRIIKADSKGGEYERTPIRNVVYVEVYETDGSVWRVPVAVFSTFEGDERPRKFLAQAAEVLRPFRPEVVG